MLDTLANEVDSWMLKHQVKAGKEAKGHAKVGLEGRRFWEDRFVDVRFAKQVILSIPGMFHETFKLNGVRSNNYVNELCGKQ